jgi:hypothetical protein
MSQSETWKYVDIFVIYSRFCFSAKVKDRIRTIHLDRERVLSRGDPISGTTFCWEIYFFSIIRSSFLVSTCIWSESWTVTGITFSNQPLHFSDLRLKQEQQRLKKQAKQHPSSSLSTANRCVLPVGASMNETDQSTSWNCDRTVAQGWQTFLFVRMCPNIQIWCVFHHQIYRILMQILTHSWLL